MIKLQDVTQDELLYGSMACAGCGGVVALRLALKVLGKNTVMVLPAGCITPNVGSGTYYLCGNTWFSPSYGADGLYYKVVPTP